MNKVLVIGAGASGLTAAIMASRYGSVVTVLEKNKQNGKKIIVSGSGRCNYFNDDFNIKHYHSENINILSNIINEENKNKVLDFMKSIGVVERIENGYYYPYSNQSISVLSALEREAKKLNVNIVNNSFVTSIKYDNNLFVVTTDDETYTANKLILATGSNAYYKDLVNTYELAKSLDLNIIDVKPALVQLIVNNSITKKWAGVRCKVKLDLYEDNIFIKQEKGEVTLTDYGISGICALNLSGIIKRGLSKHKYNIKINFVPNIASNPEDMIKYLDNYSKIINDRLVIELLDNLINYKLGNILVSNLVNKKYNDLKKHEKELIATNLTSFNVLINDTKEFNDAQVSSGGVDLEEIDIKTFESHKIKNLYIIGELLDVYGDCGGYNLGFAWLSGIIAGSSVNND